MATNIGMIGIMGSNLARNMVSKGFAVSCYDWDELLRKGFAERVNEALVHWRNAVACMTRAGIASPAMSSAVSYYDGFRTGRGGSTSSSGYVV